MAGSPTAFADANLEKKLRAAATQHGYISHNIILNDTVVTFPAELYGEQKISRRWRIWAPLMRYPLP
jgi:hypothetical protein